MGNLYFSWKKIRYLFYKAPGIYFASSWELVRMLWPHRKWMDFFTQNYYMYIYISLQRKVHAYFYLYIHMTVRFSLIQLFLLHIILSIGELFYYFQFSLSKNDYYNVWWLISEIPTRKENKYKIIFNSRKIYEFRIEGQRNVFFK